MRNQTLALFTKPNADSRGRYNPEIAGYTAYLVTRGKTIDKWLVLNQDDALAEAQSRAKRFGYAGVRQKE